MARSRKQSEAAARQTVGFLGGSLVGFAIGFRLLMSTDAAASPNQWATCLVIVIGCGIAGMLLASVANAFQGPAAKPPPRKDKPDDRRMSPKDEGSGMDESGIRH